MLFCVIRRPCACLESETDFSASLSVRWIGCQWQPFCHVTIPFVMLLSTYPDASFLSECLVFIRAPNLFIRLPSIIIRVPSFYQNQHALMVILIYMNMIMHLELNNAHQQRTNFIVIMQSELKSFNVIPRLGMMLRYFWTIAILNNSE